MNSSVATMISAKFIAAIVGAALAITGAMMQGMLRNPLADSYALGVSGGIVPCPSALVVLLAAVALHRIVYGMILITAFSVGLASVLIAIGLLVVIAGNWLKRFLFSGPIMDRRPILSAVAITVIGFVLVASALSPGSGPT